MASRRIRFRGLLATVVGASLVLAACSVGGKAPEKGYVTTAPGSVRVVAVGDIACEPGERTTAKTCQDEATAALATRLRPDLVLTLGDHQYEAATKDKFMESYDESWGPLWKKTRPALGNHEYYDPNADGYYDYFEYRQPGPPGRYRFKAKGWNVYVLNSNCDRVDCREQVDWLERKVREDPATCSIVTMHHPRHSSGSGHGSNRSVQGLWAAAARSGTDVMLAGHDHSYERFAAMGPRGKVRPRTGMVSYVSGTGGRSLHPLGDRKRGSRYFQADEHGVLFLELKPSSWSWRFVGIDGRVLDRGTRNCR